MAIFVFLSGAKNLMTKWPKTLEGLRHKCFGEKIFLDDLSMELCQTL